MAAPSGMTVMMPQASPKADVFMDVDGDAESQPSGVASDAGEIRDKPRRSSPLAAPRSAVSAVSADTARADSVDSSSAGNDQYTKNGKKRKKKGWKGYAMQYLDDDGNIIEERKRDETPPSGTEAALADAEPSGRTRGARAAVKRVQKEPPKVKKEVVQKRAMSELTLTSESRIATPEDTSRTADSDPVASSPASPAHVPTLAHAPAAPALKALAKGPKSALVQSQTRPKSSSPRPTTVKIHVPPSAPMSKGDSAKGSSSKLPPAKRRKMSPSNEGTPSESRGSSSAPTRPAAPAAKKGRFSLPTMPTSRQAAAAANAAAAALAREARLESRELRNDNGQPWVVNDDAPLPKLRYGMGDGFPSPPRSDLRDIKEEVEYINKTIEEERKRRGEPPTPPYTGARGEETPEDPILVPTVPVPEEPFESQFNDMLRVFDKPNIRHIMPSRVSDPRPPQFAEGQGPTVVLAPKRMFVDVHDIAHSRGYEGLPPQFEPEIMGFVNNVRANARTLVQYYFRTNPDRRDAFMERLGRELSLFGLELTNDGEMAMARAPRLVPPEVNRKS